MYLTYLLNTAYGLQAAFTGYTGIDDPHAFLTLFLHRLDPKQVTRSGLDESMDILFAHQNMIDFIKDPSNQTKIIFPVFMKKYWDYIIVPAWDQHASLHKIMSETT